MPNIELTAEQIVQFKNSLLSLEKSYDSITNDLLWEKSLNKKILDTICDYLKAYEFPDHISEFGLMIRKEDINKGKDSRSISLIPRYDQAGMLFLDLLIMPNTKTIDLDNKSKLPVKDPEKAFSGSFKRVTPALLVKIPLDSKEGIAIQTKARKAAILIEISKDAYSYFMDNPDYILDSSVQSHYEDTIEFVEMMREIEIGQMFPDSPFIDHTTIASKPFVHVKKKREGVRVEDECSIVIHLISDYCECDLWTAVTDKMNVLEKNPDQTGAIPLQYVQIADDILAALELMHGEELVHRDIKPANILLYRDVAGSFRAKLTDFGATRSLHDDPLGCERHATPWYQSPAAHLCLLNGVHSQFFRDNAKNSFGASTEFTPAIISETIPDQASKADDLWAAGVTLFQLFTGKFPSFCDKSSDLKFADKRFTESVIDNNPLLGYLLNPKIDPNISAEEALYILREQKSACRKIMFQPDRPVVPRSAPTLIDQIYDNIKQPTINQINDLVQELNKTALPDIVKNLLYKTQDWFENENADNITGLENQASKLTPENLKAILILLRRYKLKTEARPQKRFSLGSCLPQLSNRDSSSEKNISASNRLDETISILQKALADKSKGRRLKKY